MSTNNIEVIPNSIDVKHCWAKIKSANGIDFFIDKFYQLMFSRHPETASLFPQNLDEQKRTLLATLDNVINGIEYIEELENELMALGQRHKNIGITKDMYKIFLSTIGETANLSSNYSLTDKELCAWEDAFRKFAT